ncbi:MAG: hypothetical protein DRP93_00155 [Candidatus Neomarinimicrobiota bacterium]|nr:MAG: hypothetical protein DRP93_00155 [Candidatus Neomarinimicrobiota bacterium]
MGKNAKKLLKDASLELILKKGPKAVRVQEICKLAGVSKMSFYYYYDNKRHIIEDVIKGWLDQLLEESKQIMNCNIPFSEKIVELVEWKADFVKSMSQAFLQELYDSDGEYSYLVKDIMSETQKLTYMFFSSGKKQGELNKNVDVSTIMLWMNIISDMAIEGKFNQLFDDPKEMNKQIRNLMLYGVLGNTK